MKIEKRIDEYAIDEDTVCSRQKILQKRHFQWSDELGAFHHGYSDEANPRLVQKDKEIICLVVEVISFPVLRILIVLCLLQTTLLLKVAVSVTETNSTV